MSASEKLRALNEGLNVTDGVAAGLQLQASVLTVKRALPQLLAVVEAAEDTRENHWKLGASQDWTEYHEARERMLAALSALDEALS